MLCNVMYFCFDSESCNLETKCLTYVNSKLSLAKHDGPTCNYETSIHGHCCKVKATGDWVQAHGLLSCGDRTLYHQCLGMLKVRN